MEHSNTSSLAQFIRVSFSIFHITLVLIVHNDELNQQQQ
jgi:hypothetical protein